MREFFLLFFGVILLLVMGLTGLTVGGLYINKLVNNKTCTVDIPTSIIVDKFELSASERFFIKQYLLEVRSSGDTTHLVIYDNFLLLGAKEKVGKNITVSCD